MKLYNKVIYAFLATSLTFLMFHLVYVHAEILDNINPYSRSFVRSIFFAIAYSFMTVTVIALLQSEKANRYFALADAIAILLYYATPLFTAEFDILRFILSLYYSLLSAIATFMLGSLAIKFFGQTQVIVDTEKVTLRNRLDTIVSALEESEKAKVSLNKNIDTLKNEALSLKNNNDTLVQLNDTLNSEIDLSIEMRIQALRWQKAIAGKRKDVVRFNQLQNEIEMLGKKIKTLEL